MIQVRVPHHLGTLAGTGRLIEVDVADPVTLRRVLDALETAHPELRGTMRDPVTEERRPFVRFFACEEDLSHDSPDAALPDAVASGRELLHVVGAMAGG
jgi:hypothetical protein